MFVLIPVGLILLVWLLVDVLSWHLAAAMLGRRPRGWPALYRPFVWAYHKLTHQP